MWREKEKEKLYLKSTFLKVAHNCMPLTKAILSKPFYKVNSSWVPSHESHLSIFPVFFWLILAKAIDLLGHKECVTVDYS